MTPHAISDETHVNGVHCAAVDHSKSNGFPINHAHQNGVTQQSLKAHHGVPIDSRPSFLSRSPENELHDLICVGFGPASLAIAVALNDAIEFRSSDVPSSFRSSPPRVLFLERQDKFAWHSGMQFDGAKMQISWIKDLATLRTPRSAFTFLSYLHANDRLVPFTNLGTFIPLRCEYESYMSWCADHFKDVVSYQHEGYEVVPVKIRETKGALFDAFQVRTRNLRTGAVETRTTRHVVLSLGGKPKIPQPLPQNHPRVIHSSAYNFGVDRVLPDRNANYKIVVVGAGQSAAETFNESHARYPNSQTRLIIRGGALKPSDDSPFVNEIFDGGERIDRTYAAPADKRAADLASFKSTNYGVVQIALLEHIYFDLYKQRLKYQSEADWPHRILAHRDVISINDVNNVTEPKTFISGNSPERSAPMRVHMVNHDPSNANSGGSHEEVIEADLVIVASGYERNAHEALLQPTAHLLPAPDSKAAKPRFDVGRDYKVQFEDGVVASDAGVWLQGCNEETHGLSDTLLSILATRGGEIVHSIFGDDGNAQSNGVNGHAIRNRVDS